MKEDDIPKKDHKKGDFLIGSNPIREFSYIVKQLLYYI